MNQKITLTSDSRVSAPFSPDTGGKVFVHVHKDNNSAASVRIQADFGDPLAGTYDNVELLKQGISTVELSTQASYILVLDNANEQETCHVRIYD